MKAVILWAFLLSAVRSGDFSAVSQCAADPTNFKFTLKSYRNQTGYWTAQAQLKHTDVQKDGAACDVDIEHTFTPRSDGSGVVLVVASITVPSKGYAFVKPQRPKFIPEGYKKFSEADYIKAHTEHVSWGNARDICNKEGAHLAIINSEAEAKFVASLWNSNSKWAFIGNHDLYVEGTYVTIYNETLPCAGYDKWYPGEPDGGTEQNCGLINVNSLLGNSFCNQGLPFFCELQY